MGALLSFNKPNVSTICEILPGQKTFESMDIELLAFSQLSDLKYRSRSSNWFQWRVQWCLPQYEIDRNQSVHVWKQAKMNISFLKPCSMGSLPWMSIVPNTYKFHQKSLRILWGKRFSLSDTTMTFTEGQEHSNWYQPVDFRSSYHQAKFETDWFLNGNMCVTANCWSN